MCSEGSFGPFVNCPTAQELSQDSGRHRCWSTCVDLLQKYSAACLQREKDARLVRGKQKGRDVLKPSIHAGS